MKNLDKKVKKADVLDIGLIKLSVAAFVFFVITVWPAAMTLTHSINSWYFFIAALLFAARPFKRIWLS